MQQVHRDSIFGWYMAVMLILILVLEVHGRSHSTAQKAYNLKKLFLAW